MQYTISDILKHRPVCFIVKEADGQATTYDANNLPKHLIYNSSLTDGRAHKDIDFFYGEFWSDTTLSHIIDSCVDRIKSLVSRGHHADQDWEYGPILVKFLDTNPLDHDKPKWMTKIRTEVYLRPLQENPE